MSLISYRKVKGGRGLRCLFWRCAFTGRFFLLGMGVQATVILVAFEMITVFIAAIYTAATKDERVSYKVSAYFSKKIKRVTLYEILYGVFFVGHVYFCVKVAIYI